ncbi:MAG TPA: hypothetical protein VHL54_06730 [Actinomycetota bacterium]|nr:hypothetical protein [Actinomycetota bacterium]
MSVETDFERACLKAIEECKAFGYSPTAWIAMINDIGAVAAAEKLVVSGDIQSGFLRLARQNRLDLTIEMAVLNPKWDSLFLDKRDVREAAWWRLSQAVRS